jgi:hypothetical protein
MVISEVACNWLAVCLPVSCCRFLAIGCCRFLDCLPGSCGTRLRFREERHCKFFRGIHVRIVIRQSQVRHVV